jgi:FKBP-type peptidyl-prolyl cis-trans isomerase
MQGSGGMAASRDSGKNTLQMKTNMLAELSLCCLALLVGGRQESFAADAGLTTDSQKAGYAFGLNIGSQLKSDKISADPEFLGKGAKALLTGAPGLMTGKEAKALLKVLPTVPASLPAGEKNFKSVEQEIGYAIGFNFAQRMNASDLSPADLDVDQLVKGAQDALAGKPPLLTTNQISDVMKVLQAKTAANQAAKRKQQEAIFKEESAKDNLKEGTEFMAKNKSAPGIITLTNGMQYSVITAGAGPIPKPTDTVEVNYRGTFLDGKEFDASHPGDAFVCNLAGGVIDGWLYILKRMPTGSKWKVFIPPDLAYDAQGQPARIPPNATLVFEMELLSIDSAN